MSSLLSPQRIRDPVPWWGDSLKGTCASRERPPIFPSGIMDNEDNVLLEEVSICRRGVDTPPTTGTPLPTLHLPHRHTPQPMRKDTWPENKDN